MQHDAARCNACPRLEAALATLDAHSRCLMEGYLDGRSVAEIAGSLQAPEAAVADKIRQLVDALRDRMGR
jgi:DNA-directed RNA polymerase specialized sigma24 family protein